MRVNLFRMMLVLAPLISANAEIFLRIPRTADHILKGLGGAKVYHSAVRINGSKGELSSFVFNERSDVTAERLARKLKLPLPRDSSVVMLDATKNSLTRYFVIQAPGLQETTLVTALEQSSSIFKHHRKTAPPWPAAIPALNATASFTAQCDKTRTTFLCAVSHCATPEQAVREASAILAGDGWEEMLPTTPTFRIFTQGAKHRLVFGDENRVTREVSINVLQRDGSK